jgi:OOP family OmpA-OmpF porin
MWDPIAMAGNLSGWIPGLNQLPIPTLPALPTLPVLPAFPALPTLPTLPTLPNLNAPAQPTATAAAPTADKPAEIQTPALNVPQVAVTPAEQPAAPVAVQAEVQAPAPVVAKPAAKVVDAPKEVVKPAVTLLIPVTNPAPVANKMVLAGDALFKSGKSGIRDLSKDGRVRLDEVISKINAMGPIDQIKVVGHADPTGNASANSKLAASRAKSVKSYLIAKGVKPGVIISTGMGDTQPVVQCDKTLASEALKECHAPNRRVEIEVIAKAK